MVKPIIKLCPNCIDKNVIKQCKCGCKELFFWKDNKGYYRTYKRGHQIFHSLDSGKIYDISQYKHEIDHENGKFGPNYQGGRRIKDGYWTIWKPDHPKAFGSGYVLEHRYLVEQQIGRYLEDYEIVHHINNNPLDNRIENLQLMTKLEHDRMNCIKKELWKYSR